MFKISDLPNLSSPTLETGVYSRLQRGVSTGQRRLHYSGASVTNLWFG
jgi:hypothetical protein